MRGGRLTNVISPRAHGQPQICLEKERRRATGIIALKEKGQPGSPKMTESQLAVGFCLPIVSESLTVCCCHSLSLCAFHKHTSCETPEREIALRFVFRRQIVHIGRC